MENKEDLIAGESKRSFVDGDIEKRVLDAMAEFAAGVGHELNNPLAVIRGLAQTLLPGENDPERRRALSTIVDQTCRAYEMIAAIRTFSRPPKPERKPFSATDFFENWTRTEKNRLEELGFSADVSGDEQLNDAVINSDEAMVATILEAFGKNAADALSYKALKQRFQTLDGGRKPEDGRVLFIASIRHASNAGRVLTFGVEDNGEGVDGKARELAFSPFFSGRQAGRGLGVGLSKAWRLAETLGANISCAEASTFQTGCRWTLEIPLV